MVVVVVGAFSVANLAAGAKGPAAVGLVQPLVLGKQALQIGAGTFLFKEVLGCEIVAFKLAMCRHGAIHCVDAGIYSAAADSSPVSCSACIG
jgi:hypothetical protein